MKKLNKKQNLVILPGRNIKFNIKTNHNKAHYKDKQIIKEQKQCIEYQKQYNTLLAKWKERKEIFEQDKQNKQKQYDMLIEKSEKLSKDIFIFQNRKDQITAKEDPSISHQKANILKQYLKCAKFTVGRQLQKVKFFGSQKNYRIMSFFFQKSADRYFIKSQFQAKVKSNIEKIVFIQKIKFEKEWLILSIKLDQNSILKPQSSQMKTFKTFKTKRTFFASKYKNQQSQMKYNVEIYSITGKYFYFKRTYSSSFFQDILAIQALNNKNSSSSVANSQKNTTFVPCRKRHRLSVADNIAKLNEIRSLVENMKEDGESRDQNKNHMPHLEIITQRSLMSKTVSDNSRIIKDDSQMLIDDSMNNNSNSRIVSKSLLNNSNISQNISAHSKETKFEQNSNELQHDSDESKQSAQSKFKSKSSFYPSLYSNSIKTSKFNKVFLKGQQRSVFPKQNPLLNIVLLKQKKQFYFLHQYLAISEKFSLINISIKKYKLKIQLQKELRKSLMYKIIQISQFYQTKLKFIKKSQKPIKVLCVLKKIDQNRKDVNLQCYSIQSNQQPFNFIIKIQLNREDAEDDIRKESGGYIKHSKNMKRNSNNNKKHSREGLKRSSRSSIKNSPQCERVNEKSGFANKNKEVKGNDLKFKSQIIQKFQSFYDGHIINIKQAKFKSLKIFTKHQYSILRLQSKFKSIINRKYFKQNRPTIVHNYDAENNILYCSVIRFVQEQIIVSAEMTTKDNQIKVQSEFTRFPLKYRKIIELTIKDFQTFEEVDLSEGFKQLNDLINYSITNHEEEMQRKQAEKPQRLKRLLVKMLTKLRIKINMKKNLYFIKIITVNSCSFAFIVRRSQLLVNLLECNLYELPKNDIMARHNSLLSKSNRDIISETNSRSLQNPYKPSNRKKIFTYQTIYLMKDYFKGISKKNIHEEFYIDKKAFMLKPKRQFDIHYIDRLVGIDVNSDDIVKEMLSLEKEELNIKKKERATRNDIEDKQYQRRKKKKISIQQQPEKVLEFIASSIFMPKMRQNTNSSFFKNKNTQVSKMSLDHSFSYKASKNLVKIANNCHQSIFYYSLYKAEKIFFYLDFYIIERQQQTLHGKYCFNENLKKVNHQKIYKKQLEEATQSFIYNRIAKWLLENQQEYIVFREVEDKNDDTFSKKQVNSQKQMDIPQFLNLNFFQSLFFPLKRSSIQVEKVNEIEIDKNIFLNTEKII